MPILFRFPIASTESRGAAEGAKEMVEGPTWGGLLFNVNLLFNAAYLFGTLALFATLFRPLLAAWATSGDLVEWSPKENRD